MAVFLLGGLYLGARVISPQYLKADPTKLQDNSNSNHVKGSSSAGAVATDKESPVWIDGVKPSDIPQWQPDGEVRKRKKPKNVTKFSPKGTIDTTNPATATPDVPAEPAAPPADTTPAPPVAPD
ncbi:MAG: hypothetical protein WCO98_10940 [bacterium]